MRRMKPSPAALAQQRHDALHRRRGLCCASASIRRSGENLRVLGGTPRRARRYRSRAPRSRVRPRPCAPWRGPRRRRGRAHRPALRRFRRRGGRACASRRNAASRPPIRPACRCPPIASLPSASRVIGDDAAIDFRRVGRVDGKLGLAGLLALFERRIIEKGKAHRALDLQRAVAGEEHRGRMGVDALHLRCRHGLPGRRERPAPRPGCPPRRVIPSRMPSCL